MEVLLTKMPMADAIIKQEKDITQSVGHEQGCSNSKASKTDIKIADLNSSSSSHEVLMDSREEDELESAMAEMGEVKEENERLKMMLEQIQGNYKSLQLRFLEILQQGAAMKSTDHHSDGAPEHELVSLSLGRIPTGSKKGHKSKSKEDEEFITGGLTLGLDSNPSPGNSSEELKEGDRGDQTWRPSKIQKTTSGDDEKVAEKSHVRRARVSVRTRCDAPTMFDGCQWRKYGQKISKGNPCPRAYYRCTVAPGCPVRKQVQRCVGDMSILITTYEGNHNHPLPVSATAMASTTAAAASMLLSGSSTSQPGSLSSITTSTPSTELHGLTFSSFHDSSRTRQFYSQNSTSPLFPTITLDLTGSPSSSSTYVNRFSTNFPATSRILSTNLNFCSSGSNIFPTVWGNGYLGNLNLGKESTHEQFYQSFLENNHQNGTSQQSLTEMLTKAIKSDPTFSSVIAAAISSMAGSSSARHGGQTDQTAENFSQNLMQAISSRASSSYFTGLTSSSSSQTGSSVQSSLPFSIFNGACTLDYDNKERKN